MGGRRLRQPPNGTAKQVYKSFLTNSAALVFHSLPRKREREYQARHVKRLLLICLAFSSQVYFGGQRQSLFPEFLLAHLRSYQPAHRFQILVVDP